MDPVEVEALLARAGHNLMTRGDAEGSLHFFLLAGSFVEAIHGLCEQLSHQLASSPVHSPERTFWLSASRAFYEKHLKSPGDPVERKLRESGRLDLSHCLWALVTIGTSQELFADGR